MIVNVIVGVVLLGSGVVLGISIYAYRQCNILVMESCSGGLELVTKESVARARNFVEKRGGYHDVTFIANLLFKGSFPFFAVSLLFFLCRLFYSFLR